MTARTRIAPTPSGFLHPGNALNFLLTQDLAKRIGARLRLRIDDLDRERVRPEYVQDIFDTLHWLGITWEDGPVDAAEHQAHHAQHLRLSAYLSLLDRLKERGALYACTCSRAQAVVQGSGSRCGADCWKGRIPFVDPAANWRLRVPEGARASLLDWSGARVELDVYAAIGHPVLLQRGMDGRPPRPAYQIASLSDDLAHGTTHLVRGMDLLPSSACQWYMAQLLDEQAFLEVRFHHHALVLDGHGVKLSKSAGAGSVRALRLSGAGAEVLQPELLRLLAQVP
ncbi:MAG: glutamate--tRNA ligase family protein [Flavobacteriales bacterium]